MWICSECGRSFANRNQTHTCGLRDLEEHFLGKPATIRTLFDELLTRIGALGPVTVLPEKTRIAFHVRMSFAVVSPKREWLDGHLVLAKRVEHPVFRKIETISRRNHVHHFRLASPSDLTPDFLKFLADAYAVGEQKLL